jgi:hypothetical protein
MKSALDDTDGSVSPYCQALDQPWAATRRHGVSFAPDGLALVQDFLNTRGGDDGPDLLAVADSATDWASGAFGHWSASRGSESRTLRLTDDDVTRLERLRSALDAELTGAWVDLSHRLTGVTELSLGIDSSSWMPAGDGWRWAYAAILGEVLMARSAGTWKRMKLCRKQLCRVAFYDRTWDNQAAWHNARICGPAYPRSS